MIPAPPTQRHALEALRARQDDCPRMMAYFSALPDGLKQDAILWDYVSDFCQPVRVEDLPIEKGAFEGGFHPVKVWPGTFFPREEGLARRKKRQPDGSYMVRAPASWLPHFTINMWTRYGLTMGSGLRVLGLKRALSASLGHLTRRQVDVFGLPLNLRVIVRRDEGPVEGLHEVSKWLDFSRDRSGRRDIAINPTRLHPAMPAAPPALWAADKAFEQILTSDQLYEVAVGQFVPEVGVSASTIVVPDFITASREVRDYIDHFKLGASAWSGGELVRYGARRRKVVARVSYNGRIWNPDGTEWRPAGDRGTPEVVAALEEMDTMMSLLSFELSQSALEVGQPGVAATLRQILGD